MLSGTAWGAALAVGLVAALDNIAYAGHHVGVIAALLIGAGCGGLGRLIGGRDHGR